MRKQILKRDEEFGKERNILDLRERILKREKYKFKIGSNFKKTEKFHKMKNNFKETISKREKVFRKQKINFKKGGTNWK